MARASSPPLDTGDRIPSLQLDLVDGSTLVLPRALAGRWSVVLVYRGHW